MTGIPIVRIVDDDAAVRDSLAELVRSLGLRVRCFHSAEDFLAQADLADPGCVILDICLPGLNGLALQEALRETDTRIPVIVISGHADIRSSVRSMKLGAVDFLEKPYRPSELRAIIRRAVDVDARDREHATRLRLWQEQLATLTDEEQSLLEGIVAGKTNKVIAEELDISLRTLQFRRSSLYRKLNASSRVELVQFSLQALALAPERGA